MRPDSYVFAEVYADRARYLPNVQRARHGQPPTPAPLSGSMINRIVKRRFQAAGVDPALVHTHTLRHTAAHLRWRDGQGQDILEISRFLGHSSVAVTQIYLSQKRKPIDSGWTEVEQLLSGVKP
jgi:integrase